MRLTRDLNTPKEGDLIQVRFATNKTIPDEWCNGEFLRVVGVRLEPRYLVSTTTPNSAQHRITVPVSPSSVRMAVQS
jgi:hypothetical protein